MTGTPRPPSAWPPPPPSSRRSRVPGAMVEKIKRIVQPWIAQGKLICALGGEHTITVALLQAMQTRYPDLTVVALDAHADMRESYDGSKLSHACVMRRAYELGRPLTLLGVRSYSQDDYQLLRVAPRLKVFKARELHTPAGWDQALEHLKGISGPVYLSMDLDALDPGIMPAVGTPEPGGLSYAQVLTIMETLAQRGPIIGLDLVELAPIPGQTVSEFTAARLLYKALGYIYHSRLEMTVFGFQFSVKGKLSTNARILSRNPQKNKARSHYDNIRLRSPDASMT